MNFTRQFWALLRMSLTAIPQRLGLVLTIVVGGFASSPLGFSFQLAVTAPIAGLGIAWAFAMDIVGGVLRR